MAAYLVLRSPRFNAGLASLKKRFPKVDQDVERWLSSRLAVAPREVGRRIPRTPGAWKARAPIPSANISSRGGLRVLYAIVPRVRVVVCFMLYYKRVKADVTRAEVARAIKEAWPSVKELAVARGVPASFLAKLFGK